MANIIDLLSSYQSTVEKNTNISIFYMFYVFLLMVSTILGPATIIMMIAGSYNSVLGTNLWHSFLMAIEAPIFYLLVCMTLKKSIQLQVAMAMCTMYSGVMAVVIVGTIINAVTESITSPNVIFLLGLTCFFIAAALLHPQEFFCIIHGFLYFLLIPSGYLLLMIYSLCNLHDVSWGTRETVKEKTKEELEQEKKEEEEQRKKEMETPKGIIAWLGLGDFVNDLKEFYNTMLGRKKPDSISEQLKLINENLEIIVRNNPKVDTPKVETQKDETTIDIPDPDYWNVGEDEPKKKNRILDKQKNWKDNEIFNQKDLMKMEKDEEKFWKGFIKALLEPLEKNPKKEKEVAAELKELRNKVVFAFFLTNMLWITIVFILQVMKDTLEDKFFIAIPRADDPDGDPERFEPLSLLFLLFFAIILTLQFIGTIIHRLGTFFHVIAITKLSRPFGIHAQMVDDELMDIIYKVAEVGYGHAGDEEGSDSQCSTEENVKKHHDRGPNNYPSKERPQHKHKRKGHSPRRQDHHRLGKVHFGPNHIQSNFEKNYRKYPHSHNVSYLRSISKDYRNYDYRMGYYPRYPVW